MGLTKPAQPWIYVTRTVRTVPWCPLFVKGRASSPKTLLCEITNATFTPVYWKQRT